MLVPTVADELKSLRIERDEPRSRLPGWAGPAIGATLVLVLLAVGWKVLAPRIFVAEVETTSVSLVSPAQAQQLLASMHEDLSRAVEHALERPEAALFTCTPALDIRSHEQAFLRTRLFQS
ncbi:MAG TPA: hypothetical protein VFE76_04655, partial [Myxococcales bacterium]|nr:hypothetical protein [Myxococcales bacterium]